MVWLTKSNQLLKGTEPFVLFFLRRKLGRQLFFDTNFFASPIHLFLKDHILILEDLFQS